MPVSLSVSGLAASFLVLLLIAALGVYIINMPMNPYLEGFFDTVSKTTQRACEQKYQSCINEGGNPDMCTSKYSECSSRAASKNALVSRADGSTPTGDRDKQLSAPAALQKSGKIWAPDYGFLYSGLAAESRAPEGAPLSWYQKVVQFFFPTEAFANAKAQACEKEFQTCVGGGTSVLTCTATYNKCTGATEIAKSAVQTVSTSPLYKLDASGNYVLDSAGKRIPLKTVSQYSLDTTTDPSYSSLTPGEYSLLAKRAILGQGGDTSSSKAFLASLAARMASDQEVGEPTQGQLDAAQGASDLQNLDVPDYAAYVANQKKQLPHEIPTPKQVQLTPQNQAQTYLLTPSLRQNVRQETKKMLSDILSQNDNEYEIKYVYA